MLYPNLCFNVRCVIKGTALYVLTDNSFPNLTAMV